jgi:hypothetical protein
MRTSAKLILTALAVAVVLASAVASVSARSLSASEQSIRASWTSLEFQTSLATLRCRVTIEGSFHARTIAKVARSLAGSITRVIIGHACTGGEVWADNGTESEPLGTAPNRLPFHITYESFAGTLPAISSIGFLISRTSFVFQATSFGVSARCRYGRIEDNITVSAARAAGGGITSITPVNGRSTARLVDGLLNGGLCPAEGPFAGTSGPATGLSNTSTITITLI